MFRRTLMTLRFRGGRLTFAYQRCSVVDNQTRAPGTQARRRQPSKVESERVGPSRYTEVKIVRGMSSAFSTISDNSVALPRAMTIPAGYSRCLCISCPLRSCFYDSSTRPSPPFHPFHLPLLLGHSAQPDKWNGKSNPRSCLLSILFFKGY